MKTETSCCLNHEEQGKLAKRAEKEEKKKYIQTVILKFHHLEKMKTISCKNAKKLVAYI